MDCEHLKVIAVGMGLMNVHIKNNTVFHELPSCAPADRCFVEYKPHTTNNHQMVKLLAELIKAGFLLDSCHRESEHDYMMMWSDGSRGIHKGKTINEVVCSAAYIHFKGN